MLVAILTHNQESNTIFKMNIRKEESKDYKEVFNLIENAFKNEEYTDHKEHFLVERLRNSESFVPELSLVAEIDGQIVGYILLTKIKIINDNLEETASLALAPVAVLKKYQGKGIGGKLIQKARSEERRVGKECVSKFRSRRS